MATGLTGAANAGHGVCLGYNGGTPDVWFDTSNRSTTYSQCANKPAGVTGSQFRRLGRIKTAAASPNIPAFVQDGDLFQWVTPAPPDQIISNPRVAAIP